MSSETIEATLSIAIVVMSSVLFFGLLGWTVHLQMKHKKKLRKDKS